MGGRLGAWSEVAMSEPESGTKRKGSPEGRPIGDDEIVESLSLELLREPRLDECGVGRHIGPTLHAVRPAAHASWIELRAENGIVTLDGKVPTAEQKGVAAALASRIRGTRGVINALIVEAC